ncbi:FdtA/QdtA family cupin domain-containing protein [Thalassotalea sp. Y01]|uniref:sugar 3,4-ketoisomerase n=1 Tax=Thalassotalea sp. Y01 TaxID=2729613 RepID=UPI00145E641A|nr:FdtA/QdtA family cupin domain-containing protein [Thalassotalea sp. Y01]NMP16497.1 WxcM-like domain-containing protein [Thalassotalea sp. Y01]
MKLKILNFDSLGDERGDLVSLESNLNIPFEIKRVYYLFDTDTDSVRGFHAHYELKQVVIALKGQCTFHLDDGKEKQVVVLNSPLKGLLIESFLWREMSDFSDDCVLLVIASQHYDEADYIRNYEEFLKEASQNDT